MTRRIAESFLRALPLDTRGRRAIDETLADWAHEDARPGLWGLRILRSCRAVFSIVRVVIGLAAWETVHVPFGWLTGRLALFALLPAPFYLFLGRAARLGLSNPITWDAFSFVGILSGAVVLLPLALFYAMARPPRHRPLPILGLAICSLVLVLLAGGWVLPWANQSFQEATSAVRGGSATLLARLGEQPLPALASLAVDNAAFGAARGLFVMRTGLYVLCPALVFLAPALAGLSPSRRRAWFAAITVLFLLFANLLSMVGPLGPRLRFVPGFGFWCMAAFSVVAALALNSRRAIVPPSSPVLAPQSRQSVPSAL